MQWQRTHQDSRIGRFSAIPRGYCPSGAQALEGAVRYASPFSYQHEATTLFPNSDFLSLPDHVAQSGLKLSGCTFQSPSNNGSSRAPLVSRIVATSSSQAIAKWLFRPSLHDTFCSELTIHQFTALFHARHAEDEKELDAAATECRKMKRPKHQPFARLPHPEASSTITSAPLAPAPLGNTLPPSPRMSDTGRSRSPPPGRLRPIGMNPGQPLSEPSSPAVAPSSSTIPPLTVFAGPEHGPVKGKLFFLLSGCCMASQIQWKSVSLKATKLTKQKTQKIPTTMQSPAECRDG